MSFQKLIRISSRSNQPIWSWLQANRLCSAGNSSRRSDDRVPRRAVSGKPDQSDGHRCSADGEWHVSAGLVIQRYPTLTPELNVIEKSFLECSQKLEYEKSLLSDYDYAINKVR